jgi:hypothetical protein
MIAPPDREDPADRERYMREGQALDAARESHGWLEFGPIESIESFVVTVSGMEELESMRSFREGLARAPQLLDLELGDRPAMLKHELRVVRQDGAAEGGVGSGRLRAAEHELLRRELDQRRGVVVATVRRIALRLGRRPDAVESRELLESGEILWGQATADLQPTQEQSASPFPGSRRASLSTDELAVATNRLRAAIEAVLAELSDAAIGTLVAGDQIQIQAATGAQVNAGGRGNLVQMNQELTLEIAGHFEGLEAALRALGPDARGLLDEATELRQLAATEKPPRHVLARAMRGIRDAVRAMSTAEGALAFSMRAAEAAEALSNAFGG